MSRRVGSWPLALLAAPAGVAIWGGWVGLGELTGFGEVNLLPGIVDPDGWATINSAITLPVGVEAYAAYALRAWLGGVAVPARARRFARWSAIGSLVLGAAGQVAYHLLAAAGVTTAPWWITTLVACLPVAVLGMGAALAHLLRAGDGEPATDEPVANVATTVATTPATVAIDVAIEPDVAKPVAMATVAKPAAKRPPVAKDVATVATVPDAAMAKQVADLLANDSAIDAAAVAVAIGRSERTARRYLTAARKATASAPRINGNVPELAERTT